MAPQLASRVFLDLGMERKLDQDDIIHIPLSTRRELSSYIPVTLSP
jgi:hypothetical protein